jgi:hypothetical protein
MLTIIPAIAIVVAVVAVIAFTVMAIVVAVNVVTIAINVIVVTVVVATLALLFHPHLLAIHAMLDLMTPASMGLTTASCHIMGLDSSAWGYNSLGNTLHLCPPPSFAVLVTFDSNLHWCKAELGEVRYCEFKDKEGWD